MSAAHNDLTGPVGSSPADLLLRLGSELRTPMTAIIGMGGLLVDAGLADEQREYAETIVDAAENVLQYVEDVAVYARMQDGGIPLNDDDLDVVEVVESTVGRLRTRAVAKGLELSCRIGASVPPWLRGDGARLSQLVTDLVDNAVKFSESGAIAVKVDNTAETDDAVMLRVVVRDQGPGIDSDRLRELVSVGGRSASAAAGHRGQGIGLQVVQHLATRMGGTFDIESTVGMGTTVTVTLRLAVAHPYTPSAGPNLTPARILVAAPPGDERDRTHRLLERWGMWPTCVDRGVDAFETAKASKDDPFHLVLADRDLRDIDGIELARAIGATPDLTGLPVALFSDLWNADTTERARGAGVAALLSGDLPPAHLFGLIASLNGKGATETDPTTTPPEEVPMVVDDGTVPIRVLIVEDNPMNQKVTGRMLERMGMDPTIVADGKQALDITAVEHFDVVLMDCQMPVMDGYEATEKIREREAASGAPRLAIVALTANVLKGDRVRAFDAGMDDFLTKPVRRAVLEERVRYWAAAAAGATTATVR